MNECYLNGKFVPLEEAKISILDIGLLRGYGIYDGLTAHGTNIFRFADHWERFVNGAHHLNLNIPITEDKCEKVIKELLEKHGHERSIIRMFLTGGPASDGIMYNFETPTFYILVEKWTSPPAEVYETGAKLVTYTHKRQIPEIKTTNYITAVNLQNFRQEEKALDILFVSDGEIFECGGSNIFLVENGVLVMPGEDVLGGITAKVVCELAEKKGLQIERRRVAESELNTADEVFISSSFKDIAPVTKVDDQIVGGGQVGPITKGLMADFKQLTA